MEPTICRKQREVTGLAAPTYQPQYCTALVNFFKDDPKKSLAAFCNKLGISFGALKGWATNFPEMAEAIELAVQQSQEYYEDLANDQANGSNHGKSSTLQFIMKNRFREFYKDRQEVEHTSNVVFHIDTGIKRPGDTDYIELEQKDFRNVKEVKNEAPTKEASKDSDFL